MIEGCKRKNQKAIWVCFWSGLGPASINPNGKKGIFLSAQQLAFQVFKMTYTKVNAQ